MTDDGHLPPRVLVDTTGVSTSVAPDTELSWDGCLQVDRNSSVEREAIFTVSLTLNGQPMPASQDGFAGFGKGNSRLIFACPAG